MTDTPEDAATLLLSSLFADATRIAIAEQDEERALALMQIQIAMVAGSSLTVGEMKLVRTVAAEAIESLERDPTTGTVCAMLQQVIRIADQRLDEYEKAAADA